MQAVRAQRGDAIPPVACLIGRVVPIKDVEDLFKIDADAGGMSCRKHKAGLPVRRMRTKSTRRNATLWSAVCSSDDIRALPRVSEDQRAAAESGRDRAQFDHEALPLVSFGAAYAAGVPAVSTDVGSCRQLIEGFGEEAIVRSDPPATWWGSLTLRHWVMPSPICSATSSAGTKGPASGYPSGGKILHPGNDVLCLSVALPGASNAGADVVDSDSTVPTLDQEAR